MVNLFFFFSFFLGLIGVDIEMKLGETKKAKEGLLRNIDEVRRSVNEKRKRVRVEEGERSELRSKVAILSPLMPGFFDKKRGGAGVEGGGEDKENCGEDKENCGPVGNEINKGN